MFKTTLNSSCVSLCVCVASGCAERKTHNVEERRRTGGEEEEDIEEVFTVELHRGPHGLGLALVDGMVRSSFISSSSSLLLKLKEKRHSSCFS